VLTMRKLLQTVRDFDRHVDLAIETKHPTRYAGLVEKRLVELLAEFGWAGADSPVRVMSFSPVALTRVEKLAPGLEVVLLTERAYSWRVIQGVLGPGWVAGPGIDLLRENPRLGHKLRSTGRRIHVWTVNSVEDLDLCVDLGVEAVITDNPGAILAHLLR
jgi:glycerophosphoryl diester phosphodiesterase